MSATNETVAAPAPCPPCSQLHCEDAGPNGECPVSDEYWFIGSIEARIGDVFRQHGPEDERLCDWRRCVEEPWKSLADALEVGL